MQPLQQLALPSLLGFVGPPLIPPPWILLSLPPPCPSLFLALYPSKPVPPPLGFSSAYLGLPHSARPASTQTPSPRRCYLLQRSISLSSRASRHHLAHRRLRRRNIQFEDSQTAPAYRGPWNCHLTLPSSFWPKLWSSFQSSSLPPASSLFLGCWPPPHSSFLGFSSSQPAPPLYPLLRKSLQCLVLPNLKHKWFGLRVAPLSILPLPAAPYPPPSPLGHCRF